MIKEEDAQGRLVNPTGISNMLNMYDNIQHEGIYDFSFAGGADDEILVIEVPAGKILSVINMVIVKSASNSCELVESANNTYTKGADDHLFTPEDPIANNIAPIAQIDNSGGGSSVYLLLGAPNTKNGAPNPAGYFDVDLWYILE